MDMISARKYCDSNSKARQLTKQYVWRTQRNNKIMCKYVQCYPVFFLLQSIVIKLKKDTGRVN